MRYLSDKKNLKIFFCLGLISFWVNALLFAQTPPEYKIEAVLDTTNHTIKANQLITFTNDSKNPVSEVFFHIYPNRKYTEKEKAFLYRYAAYFKIKPFPDGFQSGGLKIGYIKTDAQNLNYDIEGSDQTILKVNLPKPLSPGASIKLKIAFEVAIPHAIGRFGWHKDIIALCRWYPMLSVLNEQGWCNWPSYPYHQPYFSDAANYKLKLTVPQNQTVIHTGLLKEETANSDGTKTVFLETEFPVRDFGLAVSASYKVYSLDFGGVKINSYYLAGTEFFAKKAAESSRDLMGFYTKKFGPYPYKEFSIAPVYLGYGGTQLSNLVFIDTRAYYLPRFLVRYFDFLIAHETGHQWLYNLVGSDECNQMWIDEGFNSYFILQYLEAKYGKDAKVMVLPEFLKPVIPNFSFRQGSIDRYVYTVKNGLDRPVLGSLSSFQEPSSIFSITYSKGSRVVAMLNYILGDEAFGRLMKRYFKEYRFKNISVGEIRRIAEEESKKDLKEFFKAWLNTKEFCDYAVKAVDKNKVVIEKIGAIAMPVQTKIMLKSGREVIDNWDGVSKEHRIILNDGDVVKSVYIDPETELLEPDKVNNHWPIPLNAQPVPLYFFAYEVPVFLPQDKYSWIFGPQVTEGLGFKTSFQRPNDFIAYASSGYNFDSANINSRAGYQIKHLFNRQLSAGVEVFKIDDTDGKENTQGLKGYLRQELWPVPYGLSQVNDQITLYFLRDTEIKNTYLLGLENINNLHYRKTDEAIIGLALNLDRSGTFPDPQMGWKFGAVQELAGHMFGGDEYFWRESFELTKYHSFIPSQTLATHFKIGWGTPDDKNLFQLGGPLGLRGYPRKSIEGAKAILANIEYRFPVLKDTHLRVLDNIINFSSLGGVVFFDAGKAWFNDFDKMDFKKDVGLGLRLGIDIAGFLENVILRLDFARAVRDKKEDNRVWFGINHAF